MASDTPAVAPPCEHCFASKLHDGLYVRFCVLCRQPDWDDLRQQLANVRAEEREACAQLIASKVPLQPWLADLIRARTTP